MATRLQKSMLQPITVIYKFLTAKTRVCVWLYEQPATRIEGQLLGFDEFVSSSGALRPSRREARASRGARPAPRARRPPPEANPAAHARPAPPLPSPPPPSLRR